MPSLTIFFPAYNDAGTIASLVIAARQAAQALTTDFEILIINDGSPDQTAAIADDLARRYAEVRVVHHAVNRGYGGALRSGFSEARKDLVFYTDGDGQYDPAELTELWPAMTTGVDVVNGYKISRSDPFHRIVIGRIYHHTVKALFGLPVRDVDCDFRLIRRSVFEKVTLQRNSGVICVEMMKKFHDAGCAIAEVPVHHYHRAFGRSQFFNVRRLSRTATDLASLWVELVVLRRHIRPHGAPSLPASGSPVGMPAATRPVSGKIRGLAAMRFSPVARRVAYSCAAVGLLLMLRAPFMAASVDDLDSTNFFLGIQGYSPPSHRPHPPGFPVFIAAAKATTALAGSPLRGLTLLSTLAGALACLPIFFLARRLVGVSAAMAATVIACFTPIAWFVSVRPMSDAFGWCVGLAALALLAAGLDRRLPRADFWWAIGVLACGLAIGVRLQLSMLVMPIFLFGWLRRRRLLLWSPLLLSAAILSWAVPMLRWSGGIDAYTQAFRRTMTEAARWEPFFSSPSLSRALDRAHDVLVAPWSSAFLAVPVLALAVVGVLHGWRHRPRSVGLLVLMFAPYGAFNVLVQNTEAVRYVLPALPLIALLAAWGLAATRQVSAALANVMLVGYVAGAVALTLPALIEYRHQASPPVRALRDIAPERAGDVVVSGSGIFDRYMSFGPRRLHVISPERDEGWPRVTRYWSSGGEAPVYFLLTRGESLRGLVPPEAYQDAGTWQWTPRVFSLMAGERPNVVQRLRIDPPGWFLPRRKTAPGRRAQLDLFVRSDAGPRHVLIQGRADSPSTRRFSLRVGGQLRHEQEGGPGFLLHTTVEDAARYSAVTIDANAAFQVTRVLALDSSDAHLQPLSGFRRARQTEGMFHWLAAHATVLAHVPAGGATLRLQGRVPPEFSRPDAGLTIRWNDEPVASVALSEEAFTVAVALHPAQHGWSTLAFDTTRDGAPAPFDLQLADMSIDQLPPLNP